MAYVITTTTRKINEMSARIKAVQGGTSAGKTISIEQILIDACQRDKPGDVTSIVSESFPHLKRGAMRDFLNIMQTHGYYDDNRWNRTDSIYTFETGAILEFFSADQPDKVRGPRRKRLFINEANNVALDTFEQLEVRTKEEIFLDWNPTNEFWYYTDVEPKRDDCERIIVTYRDNEGLDQNIIKSIEQRKNRPGWWKVYGEGQLGEVEGKIFKGWDIIDEIPDEAKLVKHGVDFGYTNDPTSIVDIYKYNGSYIIDERAYQKGLSNKQIADLLPVEDLQLIVADSAEPKSIDEIKSYGKLIVGAEKGKDSVNYGIQIVQDQKIYITSRSLNVIREYRNYLWMTDRDGRIINIPEHAYSHSMDAVRYAIVQDVGNQATLGVPTNHQAFIPRYGNARVINRVKFGH
jgi:phage terminase large subunit